MIRREEIDGRACFVADLPGGLIKILFDDGEQIIRYAEPDAEKVTKTFDPDQPRDENGKWTEGAGATDMEAVRHHEKKERQIRREVERQMEVLRDSQPSYASGPPQTFTAATTQHVEAGVRALEAAVDKDPWHPVTMFHGTEQRLLSTILSEGLTVEASREERNWPEAYYKGPRGESIFLTMDALMAKKWAQSAAGSSDSRAVVVEVAIPRAERRKLIADIETAIDREDFAYQGDIRPEWIKRALVWNEERSTWDEVPLPGRKFAAADGTDTVYAVIIADGGKEQKAVEAEFTRGDSPGHPFRGNQWTDGEGGGEAEGTESRTEPGTTARRAEDRAIQARAAKMMAERDRDIAQALAARKRRQELDRRRELYRQKRAAELKKHPKPKGPTHAEQVEEVRQKFSTREWRKETGAGNSKRALYARSLVRRWRDESDGAAKHRFALMAEAGVDGGIGRLSVDLMLEEPDVRIYGKGKDRYIFAYRYEYNDWDEERVGAKSRREQSFTLSNIPLPGLGNPTSGVKVKVPVSSILASIDHMPDAREEGGGYMGRNEEEIIVKPGNYEWKRIRQGYFRASEPSFTKGDYEGHPFRGNQWGPGEGEAANDPMGTRAVTHTAEFKEWFKGSKMVNADGKPRVLYHATNADIETFRPFSHFGTQDAANQRYDNLRSFSEEIVHRDPGTFSVMPVFINASRIVRIPDLASLNDRGETYDPEFDDSEGSGEGRRRSWEAEGDLGQTLLEMDLITSDEFYEHGQGSSEEAMGILQRKGYHAIVYENDVEDAGQDSYVIFDPRRVKSAIGNKEFSKKPSIVRVRDLTAEVGRIFKGDFVGHPFTRGDVEGHPFRGNQWTEGDEQGELFATGEQGEMFPVPGKPKPPPEPEPEPDEDEEEDEPEDDTPEEGEEEERVEHQEGPEPIPYTDVVDDPPEEFFHGTAEQYLDSILEEGLTISASRGNRNFDYEYYDGPRGEGIYLTPDEGDALRYAQQAGRRDGVVLTIRLPKEKYGELNYDEAAGGDPAYTTFDIDPEWIVRARRHNEFHLPDEPEWEDIPIPGRKTAADDGYRTIYLVVTFPKAKPKVEEPEAEKATVSEFTRGDRPGHEFHGNQHTGGLAVGSDEAAGFRQGQRNEARAWLGDWQRAGSPHAKQKFIALALAGKDGGIGRDSVMRLIQSGEVTVHGDGRDAYIIAYRNETGSRTRAKTSAGASLSLMSHPPNMAWGRSIAVKVPVERILFSFDHDPEFNDSGYHGEGEIIVAPGRYKQRTNREWKAAEVEFTRGDLPGHPFRGNQWGPGEGGGAEPYLTNRDAFLGPYPKTGDWEDAEHVAYREREKSWDRSMDHALSMGEITLKEARSRGYHPDGHIDDEYGKGIEPLPETLYHVTTAASKVEAEGLKTREELNDRSGNGLGGGADNTISFTDDPETAKQIHRAMLEMRSVARGEITIDQMIEAARTGAGAKKPYLDEMVKSLGGGPEYLDQLRRGVRVEHDVHVEGSPPEKHLGPGNWRTVGDPLWENKEGQKVYGRRERDLTPEEKTEERVRVYKALAFWREQAGGPLDPLFFTSDTKALGETDPGEIQILTVHPKHKGKSSGYRVSALGEWRTFTGDAVEIEPRAKAAAAGSEITKFDPDQPRDEDGRWSAGVGTSTAALETALTPADDDRPPPTKPTEAPRRDPNAAQDFFSELDRVRELEARLADHSEEAGTFVGPPEDLAELGTLSPKQVKELGEEGQRETFGFKEKDLHAVKVRFFHGTTSGFLDSIMRKGLDPKNGHRITTNPDNGYMYEGASGESVFVTRRKDVAQMFGSLVAEKHGGRPVVLTVEVPLHEFNDMMRQDPNFPDSGQAFEHLGKIPAKWIKKIDVIEPRWYPQRWAEIAAAAQPTVTFYVTVVVKADGDEDAGEKASIPEFTRGDFPGHPFRGNQWQPGTAEFKEWFGESKVTDAEGKPAVLYHITAAKDFAQFKAGERFTIRDGQRKGERAWTSGQAIWLSPDTEHLNAGHHLREGDETPRARVIPLYVKMEKPLELTYDTESGGVEREAELKERGLPTSSFYILDEEREAALVAGYDGIIQRDKAGKILEVAVFHPTQVKSALGNSGKFNPKNPRIDRVETPEFLRGDLPGHPFRGNQWTDGEGAGTSTADAEAEQAIMAEVGEDAGTHRALSTNTWGNFREFASHPLLQSVLLNVKAAQDKYEREGGIPGVRVDNDPLIRKERVEPDAARAAIRFNHMEDSRIAEFVIDNGTDFPLPETAPPILLRRPKECYRNAGQLVLENPEKYDYAEGYVVMPGHLNEPVHHGWAIDRKTGTVVDPTLGWVPSARYVGVRLEAGQLAARVARGGLWGVTMQSGEPTDLVLKNKGYLGAPEAPKAKKPRKPTAKAPTKRKRTPRAEA